MTLTSATRSLVIFVGFVVFCVAPCVAQDAITGKVDGFIKTEMQWQHIPGVSLAVVQDGRLVLAKGYGLANVEHQVPVKPETVFLSCSVGKQFTAAAVMLLVEDGRIRLDDKITKYFPAAPEHWKNITVRHLLTHTSGIPNFPEDKPDVIDLRKDYTEDELVQIAAKLPLDFQSGEKWRYSSTGYVLLGILIGKVSGKFYGDFLQERIFKPLGMTTAHITSEADIVPNRAAGYQLVKGELKNQDWVSPTMNSTADGSLQLTVYDMAKWDEAHYGEKLLKRLSLEQMRMPATVNDGKTYPYGFGWFVGESAGHRSIEHRGSWQGFKAYIARYIDDRLTVIVFANLAEADPTKLAHGVAAIYNPALATKPIEDREPQVTATVKELIQKIAAGTVDANAFSAQATLGELLKSSGALNEIQLVERRDENSLRVYCYQLVYKKRAYLFTAKLTKEGKIALVYAHVPE